MSVTLEEQDNIKSNSSNKAKKNNQTKKAIPESREPIILKQQKRQTKIE